MTHDFWKRISPAAILFLFFFSLYAFTMSGTIQYGDEIEKYRVAQSIVDRGDFSFRPTAMRNQIGIGGKTYSIYELGQTVAQVPLYALGRLVYALFPTPDVNWITMLFVGFLNPLLTALTCVVLFRTCASLGFQQRTCLILAVVFGLGTIGWPYSRSLTREPLLGLFILLTFYAAHAFSKSQNERWLIVAGASAGFLVFSKFIQAALTPFFIIYLLFVIFQNQKRIGAKAAGILLAMAQGLVLFGLPAIAFAALQSLYALIRFNTIYSGIAGTRDNPIVGILSALPFSRPDAVAPLVFLSLEKSIFVYSPPVILSLIAWFAWARKKPTEASLCLGLALAGVVTVLARLDGDGGSWWGPRYLVQITPLLIIPIGALLELPSRTARGFWTGTLVLLSGIGLFVSATGALTSDRDYLDIMGGTGTHLAGAIDFLRHGAFDSLVVYSSPEGFPLRANPYGIVLLAIAGLMGGWLVWRMRMKESDVRESRRAGAAVWSVVLLIEFAALMTWVVAPYSQVLAAKGDTKFATANSFLSDNRQCEAIVLYQMALERETHYASQAAAQIERLMPRAPGQTIPIGNPALWIDAEGGATFREDPAVTITGDGSIRFTADAGSDASIAITSEPLGVMPNAQYELSGWLKSLSIYGTGYGIVSIFEDDGNWGKGRDTDIQSIDETSGWRPFRKTITTLSTSRRLFIKAGLYKTDGTLWADGLQLVRVDPQAPQSSVALPPLQAVKTETAGVETPAVFSFTQQPWGR